MPVLSKDTTPQEVYQLLLSLQNDGIFTYIVPTDPLGEEWACGTPEGDILKMNHEHVVAFLIGNQMTLHWLMGKLRELGRDVPSWMRTGPLPRCVACDPDGEHDPHLAHVEVWQIGDVWVPSCSDRVLDWWHTDSGPGVDERREAGAPDAWIRPLGGQS